MTHAVEKKIAGHELVTVAELDLTECSLTYGVSPCTATGSPGDECYQTRFTCQDPVNFAATTKNYRHITSIDTLPKSIIFYPDIIGKPVFSSSKFDPGGGLGKRASVTISFMDFTHHDRGVDPYVANRSYIPEDQGTFWGKLLARNIHYIGRTLRIRTGYLTEPWDWANFQDRTYVIERIDGPDRNGKITIVAKDLLKLADDDRIKIPEVSTGELLNSMNDSTTTATLKSGDGAAYGASGTAAIGSEEMTYTRSGDVLTVVRAVNGTTAASHAVDDSVQDCKVWTDENVVDIIDEILKDFVGIDESKIPYDAGLDTPTGTPDEWDDEKAIWLSFYNYTRTIAKPTGAKKLLSELCEQSQINIWHDLVNDKVKLKVNSPPLANVAVTSLNDDAHFIEESVTVKDEQEKRLSQVWVFFNKTDNSSDDSEENYANVSISRDATRESDDLFGTARIKRIFSNWMGEGNAGIALATSGRLLARYADPPKTITFMLDVKDDTLSIGDLADITTHKMQDADGSSIARRMQILEQSDPEPGHNRKYVGLTSTFGSFYGFIGPDTLLDRTSETDENKQQFAFIAPDSGFFDNGDEAYKII